MKIFVVVEGESDEIFFKHSVHTILGHEQRDVQIQRAGSDRGGISVMLNRLPQACKLYQKVIAIFFGEIIELSTAKRFLTLGFSFLPFYPLEDRPAVFAVILRRRKPLAKERIQLRVVPQTEWALHALFYFTVSSTLVSHRHSTG